MRLLLVEDYPPLQQSLAQGLRESGYAVDATGDGKEGLWYALGEHYDVIILDLMLPGVDGLSILKEIRKKGVQTHILILTARDTIEQRVEGLNLGADDYLTKPFAFEELLARVNALVRRNYQSKSPLLQVQDLVVDRESKTVTRGSTVIPLTSQEYNLLEFLAFRAGQVVTRSEILEHLYDFNADLSSNVIDVFVRRLRLKLEPDGQSRLIHTRRGLGYVLGGVD